MSCGPTRPGRPTRRELERELDAWNSRNPVGTRGVLIKDDGAHVQTTVVAPAGILGGHTVVGWFEGVRGCYLARRFSRAAS